MRTLHELIDTGDPAWPVLQEWIASAKNPIEVLECDRVLAEEALVCTQVTTHSVMGAIVYETGGILIDDGWIRILGSGSSRLKRSLPEWNKGKTFSNHGEVPPYMLIADDAVGGFFAINGGYLGNDKGNIYYFAPDTVKWESLDISYTQFIQFCLFSDTSKFYNGLRWNKWKEDVKNLNADYAYSFFPFLWTKEGKDIETVSRKVIPVQEVYDFNLGMESSIQ